MRGGQVHHVSAKSGGNWEEAIVNKQLVKQVPASQPLTKVWSVHMPGRNLGCSRVQGQVFSSCSKGNRLEHSFSLRQHVGVIWAVKKMLRFLPRRS